MRKEILRTCIVTREKLHKEELIRIVKTKDDEILIDLTGKVNGKGIYIKKDQKIIDKVIKNKILNRVLKKDIPDSIYIELKNII